MGYKRFNAGLVLLGGILMIIGIVVGLALGNAAAAPGSCGWKVVQPTYSPAQFNALVQGTAVPMFAGGVQSNLENCRGADPWLFAMLGAIPGVILILSPFLKSTDME